MSLVVALTSHSAARQTRAAGFPVDGTVIPGQPSGGVGLGLPEAGGRARGGRTYMG